MIPPLRSLPIPVLFIILTLVLIAGRDAFLVVGDPLRAIAPYDETAFLCSGMPECLRIGSAWSWKIIAEPFHAAVIFLYPYDLPGLETITDEEYFVGAITMSAVLHRLLMLSPLLYVIATLTTNMRSGLILLLTAFMAMYGWGEWLYRPVIGFYSLFADWPVYYWDYAMLVISHDFASLGYLLFLLVRLSRPKFPSHGELVLLTLCSQLLFENLGVVTGIAVFFATLLGSGEEGRLRKAFIRIGICAATSATAMLLLIALIQVVNGGSATEHAGTISSYLDRYTALVANNIRALPIIIANFISLVTLPLLVGAIAGFLIARSEAGSAGPAGWQRRAAAAAIGIVIGFAATLCVGFFVNSFLSETGRKNWGFLTMITIASAFTVRWLMTRSTAQDGDEVAS
jgi:hypothetical protein